jgi:hypothetical protein
MTVVLFVTHFFKRKNTYTFLFSTAISEGISDMFKEMGYSLNGNSKKEKVKNDQLSRSDQSERRKLRSQLMN